MISKCSKVVLTRKKFSEFEPGTVTDENLYLVGFQEVDGELVNVKVPIVDILEERGSAQSHIVPSISKYGCNDGVEFCPCFGGFIIDVLKTGKYIQINKVEPDAWIERDDEHQLNFVFSHLPLGSIAKLYLPNFGVPEANGDKPWKVYIYQVSPEDMAEISTSNCPICDFEAGQRRRCFITIDPADAKDQSDYFTRFVQLSSAAGVKTTRVAEVLNLYDGDGTGEDWGL